MALIKCPECGNEISDLAVKCPKCGYLMQENIIKTAQEGICESDKEYNTKRSKNRKIIKIGIVSVVVTVLFGFMHPVKYVKIKMDKEAPDLKNTLVELWYHVGDNVDFQKIVEDENIKVSDNVSEKLKIHIDDSAIDMNKPGKYSLVLSVKDEAGNKASDEVPVYVEDYETHKAFVDATTLEMSKLEKDGRGYEFNGIHISQSELTYLEDGALYRSLAEQLEGFYVIGENFYSGWGKTVVRTVFGTEKKESFSEMQKDVDYAMEFITPNSTLPQVLTKFQSLSVVSGDFDYEKGNFSFTISDLTSAANEMRITEKMLGYILAALEEYAPETSFEANSYNFKLSAVGIASKSDKNILTEDDFKNTQASVSDSEKTFNEYEVVKNLDSSEKGEWFTYYFFTADSDEYKGQVCTTNRGIQIGSSRNSVLYWYGKGIEGKVKGKEDKLYPPLVEMGEGHEKYFLEQAVSYVGYECKGIKSDIVFFFDSNGEVSWILYDISGMYLETKK